MCFFLEKKRTITVEYKAALFCLNTAGDIAWCTFLFSIDYMQGPTAATETLRELREAHVLFTCFFAVCECFLQQYSTT